jgi:hypothetical protein
VTPLEAFGLVAGVATIGGVILAIYYGRLQGSHIKLLAYQATVAPFPVASSTSLEEYNLALMYEPHEGEPREIESAYAQYLRFANFGHEPVRREDIAPANPLRIEVAGADVLDVSVEASHRDVCRVSLGPFEPKEGTTSLAVEFDFLDYRDGALIRLLTTSSPDRVALVGDIIGMPDGIKTVDELRGRRSLWGPTGTVLAILFEIGSLVLTAFVYRWVLGEWNSVWLMALPLVALLAPAAVSLFISEKLWPKPGPRFPSELLPRGYRHLPVAMQTALIDEDFGGFVLTAPRPEPSAGDDDASSPS